jgi:hypothetical protein
VHLPRAAISRSPPRNQVAALLAQCLAREASSTPLDPGGMGMIQQSPRGREQGNKGREGPECATAHPEHSMWDYPTDAVHARLAVGEKRRPQVNNLRFHTLTVNPSFIAPDVGLSLVMSYAQSEQLLVMTDLVERYRSESKG